MKIGSVQFYKRLILTLLALFIVIPTGFSIYFAVQTYQLSKELDVFQTPDSRLMTEENWVASTGAFPYDGPEQRAIMMGEEASLDYQNQYPGLYVDRKSSFDADIKNSVYLTFDDGPSALTPKILDELKKQDVKATFFVVYDDSPEAANLLKQIAEAGHTIGVHSTSHIYPLIYSSVDAFLKDFEKTSAWIESVTGIKPNLFRFPGGSINAYNYSTYEPIIAEMIRRGYVYYDWNVSSGDASGSYTSRTVVEGVVNGVKGKDKAIVLMHDKEGKKATLQALPMVIDQLKSSGYTLLPLNHDVKPVIFGYQE